MNGPMVMLTSNVVRRFRAIALARSASCADGLERGFEILLRELALAETQLRTHCT
jgi:hypothetical protein